MDFVVFRGTYPAREPNPEVIKNDDELIQITDEQGLQYFPKDSKNVKCAEPPKTKASKVNTYLWVIGKNENLIALEGLEVGLQLESKIIKHTNLTGGELAHCGGELWFVSEDKLFINGSSGRYGPQSGQELEDAAKAFRSEGFKVASAGYNEETGFPYAVLVGDPKWQ